MYIEPFGVEQWMNKWETKVVANLAETCVDSLSAGALLDMSGRREEITRQMMDLRLSYGDILGSEELLGAIASMYESVERENVIVMNGGSAANFIAMFTLIEPGEEVICAYPTYQ
ncbi:MAG: aminotransferase class I/II-fold pyridoxal phosphate-dependent enzyme, partial [Synergistaceae bacterium]|nr:aminotransferase class I/II-fold pyridoxal phosphate-dependent enzyme [Synergistaceae bacterium]